MHYRTLILRFVPRAAQEIVRDIYFNLRMLPNYAYDFRRFLVYSGMNKSRGQKSQKAARITLFYHQVEKGLSLASPRPGFGAEPIRQLLSDIEAYVGEFGLVEPATTAMAVLKSYIQYNNKICHDVSWVDAKLSEIMARYQVSVEMAGGWSGGVTPVKRDELMHARSGGFRKFFESRHSVRQYAGGSIPLEDIKTAVEIAQKTPSVCNRQGWRVHAFSDPKKMARLLEIQGCSRGFGDQASVVLVVTCELGAFIDVGERYQPWIDSGMFSMSLCLSLHELGYGSCCLNWSKEYSSDKKFRSESDMPESEQIIMLITVGTLPDEFVVARSFRPSVDRCLTIH